MGRAFGSPHPRFFASSSGRDRGIALQKPAGASLDDMREQKRAGTATATAMVDVAPLLDLALHMAIRADDIALAGFGADVKADFKVDGSPVTRVDREIESMLRDTVEREHPSAGVLGEEYGEELGVGRWVFDPIDGTREFVAGDPRFATLIAYELGGVPLVGVVSAPALHLRWWAGVGLGSARSYRGGVSQARVSSTRRWGRARGLIVGGLDPGRDEELVAGGVRWSRRGVSWEAVRVSSGEVDFAVARGEVWDVAPLGVIVSEAGGRFGSAVLENGQIRLVASNGHLADQAQAHLLRP